MRFVFVMDPVSSIIVDEDTTFAFMLEAQSQGHEVLHCLIQDVGWQEGRVLGRVRSARVQRDNDNPVTLGDFETIGLEDVDAVFIRKDPPFDQQYWWLSLVLEQLRGKTVVVNDPRGLREANEKLYICCFPDVIPKTLVASNKEQIRGFVTELGGRAVIKPIDGHGGEGVFLLQQKDKNINGLIEATTQGGARVALVQQFIPEVREGDKRILLVEGEPLGAILRVPQSDDVRSNIHVGGDVTATEITADDRRIIDVLRPKLIEEGLFFVGLDVIGGFLTEVNVTSPTGIQQASRLSGENLEQEVIEALVQRVNRGA